MMTSSRPARDVDPRELVVIGDGDGPDARRPNPLELLERRLLDDALAGRQDEVRARAEVLEDDRGHRHLARLHLDAGQVDDRHALGLAAGVGDGVDLGAEHAPAVREEQRPVVGVRDEQVLDGVLLAGDVPDDPLAAAVLAAVRVDRLALDVAAAGDRDDDVLVGDEVLVGHLAARVVRDARPPLAGVLALQLDELVLDDRHHAGGIGEDVLELGDELDDREVLVLDLLALERGQAGQPHVEDGLGLQLRQVEPAHEVRRGRRRRRPTRGWS